MCAVRHCRNCDVCEAFVLDLSADPFGLIDGTKDFCAVRWENSDNIDVVPLLQVCLASHSVQLYEECHVLTRNLQDNGQIIFIGREISKRRLSTREEIFIQELSTNVNRCITMQTRRATLKRTTMHCL